MGQVSKEAVVTTLEEWEDIKKLAMLAASSEETKDSWIKALEELVEKNPEASSVILPKDYIVAFLKRNSGQRKAIFMYQKVVSDALAYATKACDVPITQWKPDNVVAAWEVIRKKLMF